MRNTANSAVRQAMELSGIRQSELASYCGWVPVTLSRKMKFPLPTHELIIVADALEFLINKKRKDVERAGEIVKSLVDDK